jgi:hypothetical protein
MAEGMSVSGAAPARRGSVDRAVLAIRIGVVVYAMLLGYIGARLFTIRDEVRALEQQVERLGRAVDAHVAAAERGP